MTNIRDVLMQYGISTEMLSDEIIKNSKIEFMFNRHRYPGVYINRSCSLIYFEYMDEYVIIEEIKLNGWHCTIELTKPRTKNKIVISINIYYDISTEDGASHFVRVLSSDDNLKLDYKSEEEYFQESLINDLVFDYNFYKALSKNFVECIKLYEEEDE